MGDIKFRCDPYSQELDLEVAVAGAFCLLKQLYSGVSECLNFTAGFDEEGLTTSIQEVTGISTDKARTLCEDARRAVIAEYGIPINN